MKLFEYLKSYVATSGFVFLQETHSSIRDEKKWEDEFRGKLFFSHGKTNSCGVLIGYYATKKIEVINKKCDNYGRSLLLKINIEDRLFVLTNIYNANNKLDQVKTLTDFSQILDCVDDIQNNNIILGGDFNIIFDSFLDVKGGKPILKRHTLAKTIQIKGSLNLFDIWRIRNPKTKRFTFLKHHATGFIKRRFDYLFISNQLQDTIKKQTF